jgi:hypothetical protein
MTEQPKYSFSQILSPVADAFAEVERRDIRVKRIVLEREKYYNLARCPEFIYSHVNNPLLMRQQLGTSPGNRTIGLLWGAQIELGKESKVYGEPGYLPRDIHDPITDPPLIVGPNEPLPEYSVEIKWDEKSKSYKTIFKSKLKSNLRIHVKSRARFYQTFPRNEWTAIETLREMITEKDFRKFLRYGFILVRGQSGRVYQVFRDRCHTKVWENGRVVEEVCVYLKDGKIPLTDKLIAFKTIIETSEEEFRRLGNVYKMAA